MSVQKTDRRKVGRKILIWTGKNGWYTSSCGNFNITRDRRSWLLTNWWLGDDYRGPTLKACKDLAQQQQDRTKSRG